MKTAPGKPIFNLDLYKETKKEKDCNDKLKDYIFYILKQYSPKRLNPIIYSNQQRKYD